MTSRIREVKAGTAVLPLPQPLMLGPMEIREREYAAVQVVTDDGLRRRGVLPDAKRARGGMRRAPGGAAS